MKADDKFTFRIWLSSRLHLLAARIYDDFHTLELVHTDGSVISLSCYWQWTGSWGDGYQFDCDCEE